MATQIRYNCGLNRCDVKLMCKHVWVAPSHYSLRSVQGEWSEVVHLHEKTYALIVSTRSVEVSDTTTATSCSRNGAAQFRCCQPRRTPSRAPLRCHQFWYIDKTCCRVFTSKPFSNRENDDRLNANQRIRLSRIPCSAFSFTICTASQQVAPVSKWLCSL